MEYKADKLISKLFENQDLAYRDFNAKLIPNIDPEKIIGVRTPILRKLTKDFSKTPEAQEFLKTLPHTYYEENNIHGLIISSFKDFKTAKESLDRFLPYVDNWATCDIISPKVFKNHTSELLPAIKDWIAAGQTYTVRFAVGMLMSFYLGDNYRDEYSWMVAEIQSDQYYINMMNAWFFATALAKNYQQVLPFIEKRRLPVWVHNKTIQKAVESYRITPEQKEYLKSLKIKNQPSH